MVLSEKGYAGATIDEIVRKAGYSQGAFYNHWSSKDQMIVDLVKQVAGRQLEHLQSQSLESQHLFEGLKAISGDPKLFFELWLMAVRGHSISTYMKEHYQSWRQILADLIRTKAGDANRQPPAPEAEEKAKAKATLLMALFDGLLIQHQLDPAYFSSRLFQDAFDELVKKWVEA